MLNTVCRFIYTKYWGILYVEHCGKIYLQQILGITLCWTLWDDLFTQNTGDYFMLNTVGRLLTQNSWYYFILKSVVRFIYMKFWEILYIEHWEDLFTQNTEEYFMLNTGNIYLHKILGITSCWTLWEDLFTQNTDEYCMLSVVGIFIYTKYWGLLHVEQYGNIYLHTKLGNTLCWALWEDLFTQNTEEYCMLSVVGRFIYTKYWGILYVEHGGKIIYTKYWRLLYVEHWADLFTHNTEEYFMLNTLGRFIYTKYWGILYVEHSGKIYLHKILRNTSCWTLCEYLFT